MVLKQTGILQNKQIFQAFKVTAHNVSSFSKFTPNKLKVDNQLKQVNLFIKKIAAKLVSNTCVESSLNHAAISSWYISKLEILV